MVDAPTPMQEKMAFFWHGHFTQRWWDVNGAHRPMMGQNQLYRDIALGNFRTLTQAMALHPAMLVYLDNTDNARTRRTRTSPAS